MSDLGPYALNSDYLIDYVTTKVTERPSL